QMCKQHMVDDLRDDVFASSSMSSRLQFHSLIDKTHLDQLSAADRHVTIFPNTDNRKGIHVRSITVECGGSGALGGDDKLIAESPSGEASVVGVCHSNGPWPIFGTEQQ